MGNSTSSIIDISNSVLNSFIDKFKLDSSLKTKYDLNTSEYALNEIDISNISGADVKLTVDQIAANTAIYSFLASLNSVAKYADKLDDSSEHNKETKEEKLREGITAMLDALFSKLSFWDSKTNRQVNKDEFIDIKNNEVLQNNILEALYNSIDKLQSENKISIKNIVDGKIDVKTVQNASSDIKKYMENKFISDVNKASDKNYYYKTDDKTEFREETKDNNLLWIILGVVAGVILIVVIIIVSVNAKKASAAATQANQAQTMAMVATGIAGTKSNEKNEKKD